MNFKTEISLVLTGA